MTEQSDDGPSSTSPDPPHTDSEIGRQAVRIFRAARRRRLALPPDQRPRLSPGLVALLAERGWQIPAELLPYEDATLSDPPRPDAAA